MSKTHADCRPKRDGRARTGALPSDLYAYAEVKPLPRIGRPPRHDPKTWTITDDWPERVPVTNAEVDVSGAWFGDRFDDLFGPAPRDEKEPCPMTAPLRAALYLRVSAARQAEHDSSIPDQKRPGEAYCAARGYQPVETFIEAGASATNDRRPEFQRMIEAATTKPAPFDAVVVHSFSRFFPRSLRA